MMRIVSHIHTITMSTSGRSFAVLSRPCSFSRPLRLAHRPPPHPVAEKLLIYRITKNLHVPISNVIGISYAPTIYSTGKSKGEKMKFSDVYMRTRKKKTHTQHLLVVHIPPHSTSTYIVFHGVR